MSFALLLLTAIYVCGCVATTPIAFRLSAPLDGRTLHKTAYLDENLSEVQEDAIINALKEWECATSGKVHFEIKLHATYEDYKLIVAPAYSLIVMNAMKTHPAIVLSDANLHKTGQYTLGLYTTDVGIPEILMVESRIDPKEYGIVAEHETGHALGIMTHIQEHNSIMHAGVDPAINHITTNDLIAFCNLYWCNYKDLRGSR